ncbi:hypothetical protein AB0M39_10700, partial [Streptomyces sp. NPDC051907]
LDRRMGIGAEWERQLKQALATCQVFVPVYTKRALPKFEVIEHGFHLFVSHRSGGMREQGGPARSEGALARRARTAP